MKTTKNLEPLTVRLLRHELRQTEAKINAGTATNSDFMYAARCRLAIKLELSRRRKMELEAAL